MWKGLLGNLWSFTVLEASLQILEGIGKKKAKQIVELMDAEYPK